MQDRYVLLLQMSSEDMRNEVKEGYEIRTKWWLFESLKIETYFYWEKSCSHSALDQSVTWIKQRPDGVQE